MKTPHSKRAIISVLAVPALLGALLLAPGAKAAGPCANEAIREAQKSATLPSGSTTLPDCMALEMVSPPKKFNQKSESSKLSADGNRVIFSSLAALADTPSLAFVINPYVATRGPAGWSTQSPAAPADIAAGYDFTGRPCAYSPDYGHWVTWGSTHAQAQVGLVTAFRGTLGLPLSPLSPTVAPLTGGNESEKSGREGAIRFGECEGASIDATRIFFRIYDAAYLPGDPEPPAQQSNSGNAYEAYLDQGVPTLRLMQRDRDGVVYGGRCGARVGDGRVTNDQRLRGSVSPDASRVYFSTRPSQVEGVPCDEAANKVRIMKRLDTPTGPTISELVTSECDRVSPPCSSADGDDFLEGASQEGNRVFFVTTRQLTNSDEDATDDLYLHDSSRPAGEQLTQVSAGDGTAPTPGKGAEVLGVPDFSGDGSHVYFVAKGVLSTAANQAGESAQAGQPNLYLFDTDTGETVFIATLLPLDSATWGGSPGEGGQQAISAPRLGSDPEDHSVGGDGHILAFTSSASLSANDSDGGDADIYRYDSEDGSLQLVSKAAPGGSDGGAFGARIGGVGDRGRPGAVSVYFGRQISEDGKTIVFSTKEALDPADTDGRETAYVWRDGVVSVIPSATGPTVSMSGEEISFTSAEQLLPQDRDGTTDIYVARNGGGFPIVAPPPPCEGEACQAPFGARPAGQGARTDSFVGPGNPKGSTPSGRAKHPGRKQGKHKKNRKHKRAGHKQGGRK